MPLLALVLALPPVAHAASAAPAIRPQDPVRELRTLARRIEISPTRFDAEAERELAALVETVRREALREPAREREAARVLLDLAGADWYPPLVRSEARALGGREGRAAELALEALRGRLERDAGGELTRWIAREVLGDREAPRPRRVAAAELLGDAPGEEATTALLAAARSAEPDLREAALRSLAGRGAAEVHQLLLDALERGAIPTSLAVRHLEDAAGTLGEQASAALRRIVGRLYLSTDWRDAARAGRLVPHLGDGQAAPLLVESLRVWLRRGERGRGSRRIQGEIVAELRRISGRSHGADPEAWERWWRRVRAGRAVTAEEAERSGITLTRAEFFGLRPETDRVLFLIDRSGSMGTSFGTTQETRFERATDELVRCLEGLGEEARFGVALFHSDFRRWRRGLVPATPSNVAAARRWLEGQSPDGGTRLKAGIEEVLSVDRRRGIVDPAACEADTLVVLCDGATAEGPAWVRPWVARANEEAQLVVHCVRIGAGGDGTLEALAEATGGHLVHAGR